MDTTEPEITIHLLGDADMEATARLFNEGYDEAQRQGIGGVETRDWIVSKMRPILNEYMSMADKEAANRIADVLLSEANLSTETDTEPLDLDAIGAKYQWHVSDKETAEDLSALIAEVRRLREEKTAHKEAGCYSW